MRVGLTPAVLTRNVGRLGPASGDATFAGRGHCKWGAGKYFAICPQLDGGCASGGATQAWQGVTAHEILEASTDPEVGTGWVEGSEEGGDTCNRNFATMSFGTTQRFADDLNQACSVLSLAHRFRHVRTSPDTAAPSGQPHWHSNVPSVARHWRPHRSALSQSVVRHRRGASPKPVPNLVCAGARSWVSASRAPRTVHKSAAKSGSWSVAVVCRISRSMDQ
jgi:hypothetical protein